MKKIRYLKNVVTLKLDTEKCTGCGVCETVCPRAVFVLKDKKAVVSDLDACMECGACALNCPAKALSVNSGVGCAVAIINSALGRTGSDCCCCSEDNGKKK